MAFSNLPNGGGAGQGLKNQRSPASSVTSSAPPKYTVPRGIIGDNQDILARHHQNMGRDKQNDEINRRLEVLRSNAMKQQPREEVFNHSVNDTEHQISPDPADIDQETQSHDRSEFSNRHNVYSELGNFEKRFHH
jgi:hypothetical protein